MQNNTFSDSLFFERTESMEKPPQPLRIPDGFTEADISEEAFEYVADELIRDVIQDFCFQVHRAVKLGLYRADAVDEGRNNEKPEDIFGQVRSTAKYNINCPHCGRKIEATRFANHLENCMVGNGRQSSRNARRKIDANYDDENESDSSYSSKKKPKKKTAKGAFRKKIPISKDSSLQPIVDGTISINAASSSVGVGNEAQSHATYKEFFNQYCGVKTRKTGMCKKSLKCSQHSDDMRGAIRSEILNSYAPEQKVDDVHIDVDTVDEEGCVNYSATTLTLSRCSSPECDNSE